MYIRNAHDWDDNRVPSFFSVNDNVYIHPGTDLFMRGVTSAYVTKIGRKYVTIWSGIYGRSFRVLPRNLSPAVSE